MPPDCAMALPGDAEAFTRGIHVLFLLPINFPHNEKENINIITFKLYYSPNLNNGIIG
jgi:hypothetical protein